MMSIGRNAVFLALLLAPTAEALKTGPVTNPYLIQLEEASRQQAEREVWPVAGALASAMAPFSALALDDKIPSAEDMHEIFRDSLQNFENIEAIFPLSNIDERIAAAVATAFAPASASYYTTPPVGYWNKPAAIPFTYPNNAEVSASFSHAIDNLTNGLQMAFEKLDHLSVEEKIAAAVATVVISYPVSYEYYKYELREEERRAEAKRAVMKAKKAALAKKKDAASKKAKKKKGVKGKVDKTKSTPAKKKAEIVGKEESKPEVAPVTETELPEAEPVIVAATQSTPPVAVVQPSNREQDGGLDAYAAAYAALLAETQSAAVPGDNALAPKKESVPVTAAPVANSASTGSYLDSLSRRP